MKGPREGERKCVRTLPGQTSGSLGGLGWKRVVQALCIHCGVCIWCVCNLLCVMLSCGGVVYDIQSVCPFVNRWIGYLVCGVCGVGYTAMCGVTWNVDVYDM